MAKYDVVKDAEQFAKKQQKRADSQSKVFLTSAITYLVLTIFIGCVEIAFQEYQLTMMVFGFITAFLGLIPAICGLIFRSGYKNSLDAKLSTLTLLNDFYHKDGDFKDKGKDDAIRLFAESYRDIVEQYDRNNSQIIDSIDNLIQK